MNAAEDDLREVNAVAMEVARVVRRVTGDPGVRVFLFGSWATGCARSRSDIDIAIDGAGPIDAVQMADIREACERLPTLFSVDLVDLAGTSANFRKSVRASMVEVQP